MIAAAVILFGLLVLLIAWLIWLRFSLNETSKPKKSGVPKNQNQPPPPMQKGRIFIDGFAFEGHFSMPEDILFGLYGVPPESLYPLPMQRLLELAIEREDYEEAARIRDLINKGNEIS